MKKTLLASALAMASFGSFAANYHVLIPMGGNPSMPSTIASIQVVLNSAELPTGFLDVPYAGYDFNNVLTVSGDPNYMEGKVTFKAVGLPDGMTLTSSGQLSGKPKVKTAEGASFDVIATYKSKEGQQVYTVVVKDQKFDVTAIATGRFHTCALTTAKGVKCWGANANGQLGTGSESSTYTPVDVVGLTSGVSSISAGGSHTCAVTTAGEVKCWGYGGRGALGTGGTASSKTPVSVNGLPGAVASITSGENHNCALTTSGGLACWGANDSGQLGNSGTNDSSRPVAVSGLAEGVASVAAGYFHTCAVTAAGGAKCWGYGGDGPLGHGKWESSTVPVDVVGLSSGVASIAAGWSFSCAVTTSGAVKCWGYGGAGTLGNNNTENSNVPVDVPALSSDVSKIALGGFHGCALTSAGAVKCWGDNMYGQLGDNSTTNQLVPVDVVGLSSGVESIDTGHVHSCALLKDGGATCWGRNADGQLGNDSNVDSLIPVGMNPHEKTTLRIGLNKSQIAALALNRQTHVWRFNTLLTYTGAGPDFDKSSVTYSVKGLPAGLSFSTGGEMRGAPTAKTSTQGTEIEVTATKGSASGKQTYIIKVWDPLLNIKEVASGFAHTCALTTAGGVKCWGRNDMGQLGTSSNQNSLTAVDVDGLTSGVASISAGAFHTCAVTTSGAAKCWGYNGDGQLGTGDTFSQKVPTNVPGESSNVARIAAGAYHTCLLKTDGTVKCFGANYDGQLARGHADDDLTIATVPNLSGVVGLSSGVYHTCALTSANEVKCWGDNDYGQIGNGTVVTDSLSPVTVMTGAAQVSAGGFHNCAKTTSGGLKCWGQGEGGRLGRDVSYQATPTDVPEILVDVGGVYAGGYHTCVVTTGGGVNCWGNGTSGQIGNGSFENRTRPSQVTALVSGIKNLSLGGEHSCALTLDGGVKCWGAGSYGQLGLDTSDGYHLPFDVVQK